MSSRDLERKIRKIIGPIPRPAVQSGEDGPKKVPLSKRVEEAAAALETFSKRQRQKEIEELRKYLQLPADSSARGCKRLLICDDNDDGAKYKRAHLLTDTE